MKIMDWLNGILSKENCLIEIAKFDFKKFMYDYYNKYLKENTVADENRQKILEKCPYRGELANKEGGIEQFWAYRTADEILEKKVRLFDCDSSNDTCDVTTELYKILWNYSKNSKESLWKNTDSEESKKLWKWTKDNKEENLDTYTSFGGDTMNSFLTTYNFCKDSIDKDSELKSCLEKLAVFTHTIGNFVLVPYGFNKARYGSTRDYWDASLDILQKEGFIARSGKHFENDNLAKYINVFFLWDYIGEKGDILPLFNKEKRKFDDNQKYGILTNLDDAKEFLYTVNRAIYRRGIFMAGQLCIALGVSLDEHFRGSFSDKCINVTEIYQKMSNWLSKKKKKFSSYEEYFGKIFKWLDEEKNNEKIDKKQEYERVKAILKAVYAEMFINDVKIERECMDDKCEYEVTKKAMGIYLKYPAYGDWEMFLHGNTLQNYLRNGCRGAGNYRGAYLLRNRENENKKALTADILTSIESPINRLVKEKYDEEGEKIREDVLKIDFEGKLKEEYKDIANYIKTFAYVYYWCGNMMPVICNWSGKGDVWSNKLRHMLTKQNNVNAQDYENYMKGHANIGCIKLYSLWLDEYYKGNLQQFVKDYYFMDFCNAKDSLAVRKFTLISELQNSEKASLWFINNAKLIIQRSYRIQYQFSEDWNDSVKDEENVKSIMRYVFKQAGFTENEIEAENLATIF